MSYEDEAGLIQRHTTEPSVGSINSITNKSGNNSGLLSDYAAMNNNSAKQKQYKLQEDNKCCNKCRRKCRNCSKKPKCCNCCMCGCICLQILIAMICIMLIVIYGIVPTLHNAAPELQNVYIELFDYGYGFDVYGHHGKKNRSIIKKLYLNATGSFGVEAKNPNFAGFYMHDWTLDAISVNLYGNPEQWGNVYCCANHPHWRRIPKNDSFPHNYTFVFDQYVWYPAHSTMNLTYILFVEHLSEELFYVAWESSWMNDWRLPLSLHGGGWGKRFGFDIKVLMDCDIVVNASYFFPFEPPEMPSFIQEVDIDYNGDSEIIDDDYLQSDNDDDNLFEYYLNQIGRVPPKKYHWQQFPILNLSCSYGVGGLKVW